MSKLRMNIDIYFDSADKIELRKSKNSMKKQVIAAIVDQLKVKPEEVEALWDNPKSINFKIGDYDVNVSSASIE
jgi:hypothetical protein